MKPVHVVVLLLAGALAGATIMKMVHPATPAVRTAVVPQVQPPPAAPPEPAAQTPPPRPEPAPPVAEKLEAQHPALSASGLQPEPAPPVAEARKPSPMPPPASPRTRRETPKPQRVQAVASLAADPAPIPRPAPPPAQDPAPAPARTIPTMTPPPATPEPEHAAPVSPQVSPQVSVEVPASPAPQPHQATLNAGSLLPVRLVDGLSSERNVPGDVFQATLDRELVADGFVIAERGARVEGRVVAVDRAKVRAAAALAVELTRLHTSDGQTVAIQTENYFKHADPNHVDNTTKIAGGAIIGAAIGALAGGGKGAAIGAGVGGGAGAGDVLLTRGRPAELSSETLVTFKLKNPVPLTEKVQ